MPHWNDCPIHSRWHFDIEKESVHQMIKLGESPLVPGMLNRMKSTVLYLQVGKPDKSLRYQSILSFPKKKFFQRRYKFQIKSKHTIEKSIDNRKQGIVFLQFHRLHIFTDQKLGFSVHAYLYIPPSHSPSILSTLLPYP